MLLDDARLLNDERDEGLLLDRAGTDDGEREELLEPSGLATQPAKPTASAIAKIERNIRPPALCVLNSGLKSNGFGGF